MSKKLNKKANAALPSALTVANPADFKVELTKEASSSLPAAHHRAAQPRVRKAAVQRVTTSVAKASPKAKSARPVENVVPVAITRPSASPKPVVDRSETKFALFEPDARAVALCGSFNDWSPEATPMIRQNDGCWTAALALAPGRYQYKFLVDGQWLPDPRAHENVANEFGTLNSVVEVSV